MSAWFNFDTSDGTLIGKRDGNSDQYQMQVDDEAGSPQLWHRAGDEYGHGSTVLSPGTWYHGVVVVDESNNPELYINGAHETWVNNGGSRPYAYTHRDVDVSIGARWDGDPATGFEFDGLIDEVAVWNRSLSDQEVQDLFDSGSPISCQQAYHPADIDQSCTIDLAELEGYIDLWYYDSTANPMTVMMDGVAKFYSGNAC